MQKTVDQKIIQSYELGREIFAEYGIDVELAQKKLLDIPLSIHCWQGDDLGGFEPSGGVLGGGLAATGNYPGKARTANELRDDLNLAFSLIPGKKHRFNLHSIYAETDGKSVSRTDLKPEHYTGWVDWAKEKGLGLDFNPTCFSHPWAADGFTLTHRNKKIRQFWIDHCIACRRIGEYFGKELGSACITNIWIPDGYKDIPADRSGPRAMLVEALDEILAEKLDKKFNLDSVEPKLFGLGSEYYVVGSMEFYYGYALSRQILLTFDSGHFHPTESIADKISSVMCYLPEILLHVSRGMRWDSDHVVILNDDLLAIIQEVVRGGFLNRVHIGLDYFDASINRVAAWVIGAQATQRAILNTFLEPFDRLKNAEYDGDFTSRLALMEAHKSLPYGAIWDYFCLSQNLPVGFSFMQRIKEYEMKVLSARK